MVIWYMTAKIQQPVRDGDEPRAACQVHENEITWSGFVELIAQAAQLDHRKCSQYRSFFFLFFFFNESTDTYTHFYPRVLTRKHTLTR